MDREQCMREWLENGGREVLEEVLRKAEADNREFLKRVKPDTELLRLPMTI